jgi:SAM-dependent methyltransferase
MNCPICESSTTLLSTISRSSDPLDLQHCCSCNFTFNPNDISDSLTNGLLETTRLASVGLDVPTLQQDFEQGLSQSKYYSEFYQLKTTSDLNILDFGCSTGFFLYEASLYGHNVYGVELNKDKRGFVSNNLCLPCFKSVSELDLDLKFDRIFLFYSLEYVFDFKILIRILRHRLYAGGQLIIITPNLDDPLLTLWNSSSFQQFFFDYHSINYFSVESLHSLMRSLSITDYNLSTVQGYSILNHLNWVLNNRPYPSDFVGSDQMLQTVVRSLPHSKHEHSPLLTRIIELIEKFDRDYNKIIQESCLGNQLHLTIYN